MKSKIARITSIVLTLVMCFGLIPAKLVFAAAPETLQESNDGKTEASLSANKEPEISISSDGLKKSIKVSSDAVNNIKVQSSKLNKTDAALALWNAIGLTKEDLSGHDSVKLTEILECESLSATQEYYIELIDDSGNFSSVQVSENRYYDYQKNGLNNQNYNTDELTTRGSTYTTSGSYIITSSITQYNTHTYHAVHMAYTIALSTPPSPNTNDSPLTLALGTTDSQLSAINNAWCKAEPRSSGSTKTMPIIKNTLKMTSNYGAECKWQVTYSSNDYKKLTAWLEAKGSPKIGTRSTRIDTNGKVCKSIVVPTVSFSLKNARMTPSFSWYAGNVEIAAIHLEDSTGAWFGSNPSWRYSYNHGGSFVRDAWLSSGGYWYYIKSDTYAAQSWHSIGNVWYFFDGSCRMVRGWLNTGGHWYYLRTAKDTPIAGSEGSMCKGWIKVGGDWYYLRTSKDVPHTGPEGAMLASGTWPIGGKKYTFDSSGRCTTPNGF